MALSGASRRKKILVAMKKLLILLALLLPATLTAAEIRVRLTAATTAASRTRDDNFKTDYGSYDRDIYRIRSVSARSECTLGTGTGTLVIQWIGRPAGSNTKPAIVKRDERPLEFKPAGTLSAVFSCAFVENDAKYVALGIRDQSGTKYTGWIVRVLDSTGHILAEQASTPPLLKKFAADESATRDPVADP